MNLAPPKICYATLLSIAAAGVVPNVALAQGKKAASAQASPTATTKPVTAAEAAESEAVEGEEAPESDEGAKEEEKKKSKHNLSVSGRVGMSFGQGIFSRRKRDALSLEGKIRKTPGSEIPQEIAITSSFGVGLRYSYLVHSLSANIGAVQYVTGGRAKPQDFYIGDLSLGYGWSGYTIEAINTRISAGASVSFPTSTRSRSNFIYLGTGASVSIGTTILDSVSISLSARAGKTFHRFTGGVQQVVRDEKNIPSVVYRRNELIGGDLAFVGELNTEWSLSTSLGISWSIWDLGFSAGYTFGQGWSYPVGKDHLPTGSDIQGKPISSVGNRYYSQSMSAGVGISYSPTFAEWVKGFSISLGAGNSQRIKSDDNKTFNFPFWNFSSNAANDSSIDLTLSYGHNFEL